MSLGFPSVSLDELEDVDKLSEDESSWFASMLSVATIFGCLACGPLLDWLGRRKTLIIMNIPFIIGWTILCVAPSPAPLYMLYIGRVLTGIGSGMVSIPACVYIGEMATDRLRGVLVTWPSICMSIGVFLIYVIGLGIKSNWRLVAGVSISIPVVTITLIFIFLKESPKWLLTRGRIQEAEISFKWIRQVDENEKMPVEIREEFERLLEVTNKINEESIPPQISTISNVMEGKPTFSLNPKQTFCQRLSNFGRIFKRPDFWKPLLIHNLYFFFMQFGGIQVVQSYAADILESAGVRMDAYIASVILGAVQVLGGVAASIAFNKCGRRPISIISGAGMTLTMVGLGVYLEVSDGSEDLASIPLILMIGYIALEAVGFNLIPWGLLGELYPTKVAGIGGGITACMANLMGFAAIKFYPGFESYLRGDQPRDGGVFFFFGGVACVGTVFVFLFLPETFRKSLQEISQEFRHGSTKKRLLCC
ncbi:hypothetical protein L9F63_015529 [Diploptera punctata]|uniref:Major facilitator superfamily (MFS) profile domain-containing protein n=1 Tax=Diploptera punctata TaxID=6984 RepID=A0AAD8A5F6_DIPPU|nr:hypothetical protein L9F63_015529 [Diploptera punctata]